MKGTTNAQRNAVVGSSYTSNQLKLTYADGTSQTHTLAAPVTVDSALSTTSTNPVQNKVIKSALDAKVSTVSGKGLSTNDYTTAEKTKVSNLPDNANDTFATKTELTSAVSSVYKYKGTKDTYSALPTSGNTAGDVWNVTEAHGNIPAGTNYAWNGSAWDALGGEIDLSGYVPTSRTINGKALTGNITLSASDVTAVPTSRTINSKALSANITLSASDVGALASNGTAVKATADASGNNIVNTYATKTELTNGLAGKQNNLSFDSTPTSGSSNPVTSGGVYSAINTVNSSISSLQSTVAEKQDKLTFDSTPTSGSNNPVTSGGVYNAINSIQNALTFDSTPTSGSSNPVTSDGIYRAISEIKNLPPGYRLYLTISDDTLSYVTGTSTQDGNDIRNIYASTFKTNVKEDYGATGTVGTMPINFVGKNRKEYAGISKGSQYIPKMTHFYSYNFDSETRLGALVANSFRFDSNYSGTVTIKGTFMIQGVNGFCHPQQTNDYWGLYHTATITGSLVNNVFTLSSCRINSTTQLGVTDTSKLIKMDGTSFTEVYYKVYGNITSISVS